jgi:hypothetical protein
VGVPDQRLKAGAAGDRARRAMATMIASST